MAIYEFLKDFFGVFGKGVVQIFTGIFGGIWQMFNFTEYANAFAEHSRDGNFTIGQWILAIVCVLFITAILVMLLWLVVYAIIRFFKRYFSRKTNNQDLVDEINYLRRELKKMAIEKNKLLGLRIATAGGMDSITIGEDGSTIIGGEEEGEGRPKKKKKEDEQTGESRFYKLTEVDRIYNSDNPPQFEYDRTITLKQLCDRIRNYAAYNPDRPYRHLYYEVRIIRLFIAALATTRLVILQGISGTGKTSLPECLGHFFKNATTIASVQPSWRDRTEIFGYFNEFTKRFNETEILRAMYEATYNDNVYITVLDEMNIARVEYYFAEMLSILEMPSREQWIIDLVPSGWESDPKHVLKGRFTLPDNMWYVGTANNDDSTFAISDKVYDRGLPININDKGRFFPGEPVDGLRLSAKYMESLFKQAQEKYQVSDINKKKFNDMDDYVIEHFRLAFGNRIVKQMTEFVPAYVACGFDEGDDPKQREFLELDGLDYVLCNKILRKFESLNLAYIRDEIDDYIQYLSDNFGEMNMRESKAYLERLKKLF